MVLAHRYLEDETMMATKNSLEKTVRDIGRATPTCTLAGPRSFCNQVKKRLAGDTVRETTSDKVKQLRTEATALK